MSERLAPLPAQPVGVPWPTDAWPEDLDVAPAGVAELVTEMATDAQRFGETYAVVVVHHGRIVARHHGGALPNWEGPQIPVEATTKLRSWSMAKSVLHAAVGILVAEGRLDPAAPAPVPEWHREPGDPRAAITLDHLLTMRDGLAWNEDYVDAVISDAIAMLFGPGAPDMAAYAASRPLAHEPGSNFNYSSGTSNIVARIVGEACAAPYGSVAGFLEQRLFRPIGMTSAEIRCDDAGTFVGSSYMYATAEDFARFGLLALRAGQWNGAEIVPSAWIDHGRTPRSVDPDNGWQHGAHWWVTGDAHGSWWANGFEGQSILCAPGPDAVVVRLGRTTSECYPALGAWRAAMVHALAAAGGA